MSLLTIANALAKNVGLEVTDAVFSSPDRTWVEAVEMSNRAGEELARRVDFGALHATQLLTGDGTDQTFDLGADFSRITAGVGVKSGVTTIRPLTRAEWSSLTPVEGFPRYFLLEGNSISFWPYPADGTEITVHKQTKNWCSNGTDAWSADDNTSLIDEELMIKGLIVRWRRQAGMDYQDYEAEYEAALADIARFDDRSRL